MNSFSPTDYLVVAVYMLSMLLIGVFASRLNKDDKDFFRGGSKIPWGMAGLSLFITGFSAYMFVAASGQAYENGVSCLLLFTSNVYGCILVTFIFARLWRRTRVTSPMEYIQLRYGNPTRMLFTLLQIPCYLLGMGNMIYILSIFISSALGFTGEYHLLGLSLSGLHLCIIVTGLIIVFYTTAGGIWAVVITDTVQFIIVMVVTVIIVPLSLLALSQGGGLVDTLREFVQHPPTPDYFHWAKPTQPVSFTFAWIVLVSFSVPGGFELIQRSNCVPDERAAKKLAALATGLFLLAPLVWLAPVFLMRPLLPEMGPLWPQLKNPNEGTFVTIALMLLPNGMLGLMVSAILAASMSSLSTVFNIFSAIFTRDLYKPLFARDASPKQLMRVGRIATFLFGLCTMGMGIVLSRYEDAFTTSFTIYSHIVIAFTFPIAAGVLIKRVPWWTAILSTVCCFSTTLSLELLIPKLAEAHPVGLFAHIDAHLFEYKVFGSVLVSTLAFLVASLFYNPNDPRNRKAEELFALLKKPVREDESSRLFVPNLKTYRMIGWVLAGLGGGILVVSLLPFIEDAKRINLIAGGLFLALFAVIQWLTSARYSPFELVRRQLEQNDLESHTP